MHGRYLMMMTRWQLDYIYTPLYISKGQRAWFHHGYELPVVFRAGSSIIVSQSGYIQLANIIDIDLRIHDAYRMTSKYNFIPDSLRN